MAASYASAPSAGRALSISAVPMLAQACALHGFTVIDARQCPSAPSVSPETRASSPRSDCSSDVALRAASGTQGFGGRFGSSNAAMPVLAGAAAGVGAARPGVEGGAGWPADGEGLAGEGAEVDGVATAGLAAVGDGVVGAGLVVLGVVEASGLAAGVVLGAAAGGFAAGVVLGAAAGGFAAV